MIDDHGEIQGSGLNLLLQLSAQLATHAQLKIPSKVRIRAEQPGKQRHAETFRNAQTHGSGNEAGIDAILQTVVHVDEVLNGREQIPAGTGQLHLLSLSIEQEDSSLSLEGPDPERHRSLRAIHEFRRGRKALLRRDGQERPKEFCFDVAHLY